MDDFHLRDVITSGASSSTSQTEGEWLDLGAYEDLVAWVDVRESILRLVGSGGGGGAEGGLSALDGADAQGMGGRNNNR